MTPDQVEARFQRIEAILLANAEAIQANSEAIRAMQETIDLLLLSLDRLTQATTNFQRWKRDNDLRFNTILQEIRAMNRRITRLETP